METTSIFTAVQLALAPIFLLVAIGGLLNVMTQRLARVVDRARKLEDLLDEGEPEEAAMRHRGELADLGTRIKAANRAIQTTSASGVLVCLMTATLFTELLLGTGGEALVPLLFIATMTVLIVGLCFFLWEIHVATRTLKVRGDLLK